MAEKEIKRRMNRLWWVIIGLAAVIVLMILFDRDPEPNTQPWKDTIARLEQEKATIKLEQTQIIRRSKDKAKTDSLNLVAQDSKIQALEKKAAKARTPRVDTLILDNPDLASFVETQAEIIQEFKVQVDTLKEALKFRERLFKDLVKSEEAEDSVNNQIRAVDLAQIAKLEKDLKKQKRGKRWLKAGAVAGTIAGFVLGSQL